MCCSTWCYVQQYPDNSSAQSIGLDAVRPGTRRCCAPRRPGWRTCWARRARRRPPPAPRARRWARSWRRRCSGSPRCAGRRDAMHVGNQPDPMRACLDFMPAPDAGVPALLARAPWSSPPGEAWHGTMMCSPRQVPPSTYGCVRHIHVQPLAPYRLAKTSAARLRAACSCCKQRASEKDRTADASPVLEASCRLQVTAELAVCRTELAACRAELARARAAPGAARSAGPAAAPQPAPQPRAAPPPRAGSMPVAPEPDLVQGASLSLGAARGGHTGAAARPAARGALWDSASGEGSGSVGVRTVSQPRAARRAGAPGGSAEAAAGGGALRNLASALATAAAPAGPAGPGSAAWAQAAAAATVPAPKDDRQAFEQLAAAGGSAGRGAFGSTTASSSSALGAVAAGARPHASIASRPGRILSLHRSCVPPAPHPCLCPFLRFHTLQLLQPADMSSESCRPCSGPSSTSHDHLAHASPAPVLCR